jgi:Transglutaminase-like superfamily
VKTPMLVARAFLALLCADVLLFHRGFRRLYEEVKDARVSRGRGPSDLRAVLKAVDVASVLYFKEVRCLQRSAATVLLLRKAGAPAELVIGVQPWPLRAHAWVEIDGTVVNDRPHITGAFAVIERCSPEEEVSR